MTIRPPGKAARNCSALAVAGVAFLPATLAGSGTAAPAPVAQDAGADDVFVFEARAENTAATDSGAHSVRRCLDLPGVSGTASLSRYLGQWSGLVTGTGTGNADALKSCVDAVPGWAATLNPADAGAGARTYTVRPAVRTVGNPRVEEQREACFALPGVEAVGQGESMPVVYRVTVPASGAEAFGKCIGAVVGLYVPELDQPDAAPTGVTGCPLTVSRAGSDGGSQSTRG